MQFVNFYILAVSAIFGSEQTVQGTDVLNYFTRVSINELLKLLLLPSDRSQK